jgi:hypothetical protein
MTFQMNIAEVLLLHIVSCAFMTGLIWVIQILHYPAFRFVAAAQFKNFHEFHSRNITFIVLPVMGFELLTAFALVYLSQSLVMLWVNAIGVGLIWLSTLLVSVPSHNALARGSDVQAMQRLVSTNWIRTLLWTARLIFLLYIFITAYL